MEIGYFTLQFPNKKAFVTLGLFFVFLSATYGQNQALADSLETIYFKGAFKGQDKLKILKQLAQNHTNTEKKLSFSIELIDTATKLDSIAYILDGQLEKGNALRLKADLSHALESYLQAAQIADDNKLTRSLGIVNTSIADVYSVMGNSNNAKNYYAKAIQLLRKVGDSVPLANTLLNAGDEYFNSEDYETALQYFEESSIIYKKVNFYIGTAYNLGNVGMVHAEQGNDALAEQYINESISILEEFQDYYPISVYLTYMSDIYLRQNDFPTALSYGKRSLELATLYGLKDQISEANLTLSELYENHGDYEASHSYYKAHIAYRDSVKNIEAIEQMADQRTNYEVSQKQIEVDLADQRHKNQQNIAIGTGIALLLSGLLAIGLFRRNTFIKKTNRIIEKERDRSDTLLLNILPAETAKELKEKGSVKAKKYESVTVLFTDFKGFTSYSEKLSPEALVATVGVYFSKFDAIIEKHGLEKIKTIGDAYMCAGGLHSHTEDHAQRMVLAAFEIAEFVAETKEDANASNMIFDIRIGINTGPVVAGVVGTKKFAYDIWGDTVNVASRMESMSEPGRINVSENTYSRIKDYFVCEPRGEINVKNRGLMGMYFVDGIKMSLS